MQHVHADAWHTEIPKEAEDALGRPDTYGSVFFHDPSATIPAIATSLREVSVDTVRKQLLLLLAVLPRLTKLPPQERAAEIKRSSAEMRASFGGTPCACCCQKSTHTRVRFNAYKRTPSSPQTMTTMVRARPKKMQHQARPRRPYPKLLRRPQLLRARLNHKFLRSRAAVAAVAAVGGA